MEEREKDKEGNREEAKKNEVFRIDLLRHLKTSVGFALMRCRIRDGNYRVYPFVDIVAFECKTTDINDCLRNVLSTGSETSNEKSRCRFAVPVASLLCGPLQGASQRSADTVGTSAELCCLNISDSLINTTIPRIFIDSSSEVAGGIFISPPVSFC
jgi:hypothetical protein